MSDAGVGTIAAARPLRTAIAAMVMPPIRKVMAVVWNGGMSPPFSDVSEARVDHSNTAPKPSAVAIRGVMMLAALPFA